MSVPATASVEGRRKIATAPRYETLLASLAKSTNFTRKEGKTRRRWFK
jgi:hypothetical protein